MLKRNRVLIVLAMVALACFALSLGRLAAVDGWKVEIVSGDKSAVLTEADAAAMEAQSVKAAFLRSTGRIEGPSVYTGIPITAALAQVGGIQPEQAIRVTARDGYQMVYSYAQVQGSVFTYDAKGNVLRVGGPSMVLAFGSERDPADKLPRIIFAQSAVDAITDGHLWAKAVAKIEVIPGVEDWQIGLSGMENVWLDGHYVFNDDLAQKGYTVRVVSKDGFAAEFDSKLVARNDDIIVAYLRNGEYLAEGSAPLRMVGSGLPSKKHSVKQIAAVEIVGF